MANRGKFWREMKRAATNVLNQKEANFILTAILTLFLIYIALVGIFGRNVIHPLGGDQSKPQNFPMSNAAQSNFSYTMVGGVPTKELGPTEIFVCSAFSLFILWSVALVLGRLLNYLRLPPLLGMLIAGILFGNIPFLQGILIIHKDWNKFLRQSAFILILMRCGIGLDPDALRNSLAICGTLGVLSTTFEALAIVLTSYFIYEVPVSLAIVFSYVLASTSPAVTVPTMIQLHAEGRGVDKGIPTVALASASIDNIYCVTAFSIALSIVFHTSGDFIYMLAKVPMEILAGSLLGILAGFVLRYLPRYDDNLVHLARSILIFVTSMAIYFGTLAVRCHIAGPLAVILACIGAKMKWKDDNPEKTRLEELSLKVLWDLFFLPFLFVLIGLVLDFSVFTLDLLGKSVVIIFIGIVARIVIVFVLSFCTNLNIKEQCFLSFCFTPKATVQAALAPILAQHSMEHTETSNYTQLILQTCILSILITAPIGQIIIQVLGRATLKKNITDEQKLVETFPVGSVESNGSISNVLQPNGHNNFQLRAENKK
ncbi:sodium/hydrogen exchanger family domain-containing protein [Ditylenchus destructor]|uniref:Sodium/hydrogen exchanger family domain-containing protein n=1 Tax=Ditylenchus destructor TaxID=166010 RepID=A0AAD4MND4_9BILA|nr:sodium/hydrogen exchanger family domain-containing protein [Ditylenchus destructor]